MVLAIGLVVDDAIVVLENIHRHIEDGMKPVRAAIVGIGELSGAVVAMTLTLAAVYAPVAFSPGRTGKLFAEFALTLAGAVIVSGIVALTLSPMLCSKLLRGHEKHGRFYNLVENGLTTLNRNYRRLLTATLGMRPLVMLAALVVADPAIFCSAPSSPNWPRSRTAVSCSPPVSRRKVQPSSSPIAIPARCRPCSIKYPRWRPIS